MTLRVALLSLALLASAVLSATGARAGEPVALPPEGPWVVRIHGADRAQLTALSERIDFWTVDRTGGFAVALVDAVERDALSSEGFDLEVDTARTAEFHRPHGLLRGQVGGIPGFPCYRTVEETYADLAALAVAHPTLASWTQLGESWEKINGPGGGYELRDLVLTNAERAGPKAPMILIGAMHAREYTTAELLTRFAEELVDGYGSDADATWILDHVEIHVVPQLNPDGRKRAEAGASWRKNVNDAEPTCDDIPSLRGIDLNRNSSFLWGGSGSSGWQCSEIYRGPGEASEPETVAIEALMASVFPDQRGPALLDAAPSDATGVFISVHSWGEYVLYPWEAIPDAAPNEPAIETLGRKFGFYNDYDICQDCLPVAAGTTVDEAYGEYGVAAYTFELGNSFFESCTSFESTVLPDNLAALRFAAKAARRPYLEPAGPEIVSLTGLRLPDGVTLELAGVADDTRFDSNGHGIEPTQTVQSVSYTVDDAPWEAGAAPVPIAALDGSFDEEAEAFSGAIDLAPLGAGRHLLYVTATDSNGQRGVPTGILVEFLGVPIFSGDFEEGDFEGWSAQVGAAAVVEGG